MSLKRKRVKAYVDALSKIVTEGNVSREKAIEILKVCLEREGVEPFRGISKPPDIYEKELISLYIIGSRGLGVNEDFPECFNTVFGIEQRYDNILKVLESHGNGGVRESIREILGRDVNESDVARVLRFAVTLYYLDFVDSDYVIKIFKKVLETYPEYVETVRRFAKFFIAIKLSSDIAKGAVRDRVSKEISKQVLSLNIGVPKAAPSDNYVGEIAKILFGIPRSTLSKILKESK